MLLADLVATADTVAATPARNAKVAALAGVLQRCEPDEVASTVALLSGETLQGRFGVGWATLGALDVEPATQPSLTVAELDATFAEIASMSGPRSAQNRAARLRDLFRKMTRGEQSFVRRLLGEGLRQGALAGVMTEAVARAAGVPSVEVRRAQMLSGDLPATAARAMSGAPLSDVGLRLMHPVQPMLASTASCVEDALAITGVASVEWKLDGIRVQVHRDGDDVAVYTRNLNAIDVPSVARVAASLPARNFVIDGEAIALDADDRPHLFQETMTRAADIVPRFFDVLHLDGEDLIDRPLSQRLEALDRVARPWRIPGALTADAGHASTILDDALAHGHEGIVVKSAASTYMAGRRGKQWLKIKPVRTLDLVVIGVEWGSGRRKGWLSNLHLGARGADGGFVMVGKTFKGLTDELLGWQTQELLARETSRTGHIVWVRPELVVEIALDGVQVSRRYPAGVALRFARVKRYRADKSPADADTIDTVRSLLARS